MRVVWSGLRLRGEGDGEDAACGGEDGGAVALDGEVGGGLEGGDVDGDGAGVGEGDGLGLRRRCRPGGGEGEGALRGGVGDERGGVGGEATETGAAVPVRSMKSGPLRASLSMTRVPVSVVGG